MGALIEVYYASVSLLSRSRLDQTERTLNGDFLFYFLLELENFCFFIDTDVLCSDDSRINYPRLYPSQAKFVVYRVSCQVKFRKRFS